MPFVGGCCAGARHVQSNKVANQNAQVRVFIVASVAPRRLGSKSDLPCRSPIAQNASLVWTALTPLASRLQTHLIERSSWLTTISARGRRSAKPPLLLGP